MNYESNQLPTEFNQLPTIDQIIQTVGNRSLSIKKDYLDIAIAEYRQQIENWDAIIEYLAGDYDAPDEAIEYAFASWLIELIDKIMEEPNWFVQNIESKEFDETLAEFTPEEVDEEPDWYGNDF